MKAPLVDVSSVLIGIFNICHCSLLAGNFKLTIMAFVFLYSYCSVLLKTDANGRNPGTSSSNCSEASPG